jgi:glycosyltransferase involved in cell wall biosynthesis
LKEIVGDSALIVDPYDYEGIANAILVLISDSKVRQQRVQQGFENIKRFEWKKTAEEVFQVYQEIWERSRNGTN